MPADTSGRFRVSAEGSLQVGETVSLELLYAPPAGGMQAGGNLWIFYDIRQFGDRKHAYDAADGISVSGPEGTSWEAEGLMDGRQVRTFDIHPPAPEFLHAVHVKCVGGSVAEGDRVVIQIGTAPDGFVLPVNAIDAFYFWLVEDPAGELSLYHPERDKYHYFLPRDAELSVLESNPLTITAAEPAALQVTTPSHSAGQATTRVVVTDRYGNPVRDAAGEVRLRTARGETTAALSSFSAEGTVPLEGPADSVRVSFGEIEGASNPVRVEADTSPYTLYWGDPHGMLFNQRPIVEHFAWGKDVNDLDFAGGQLFSYSICIEEIWDELQDAWRQYDLPGEFVALPSAEFATGPDGSHRHGFFPAPEGQPPVFCEDRPAANDPKLHARYHPDTIYCRDYQEFYREMKRRGALIHGHFHTHFYVQEHLAEIYQKQQTDGVTEEEKINQFLMRGVKLGIVSGSDTHDNRPANPYKEPGPSGPAGLTGVWAERLDRSTILDAFFNRRCYATTGVRIVVDFRVNGGWVGSTVQADRFAFTADVVGTTDIEQIDLVVNGDTAKSYTPNGQHVQLEDDVPVRFSPVGANYCYLRVRQVDGNRAWTSPIWLEPMA